MSWRQTSAWPLALSWALLIVYASLYPFANWRDQGVLPWEFLLAPWPRYWGGFDVLANVLGYVPLGFLLALVWVRARGQLRLAGALGLWLAASALSLLMEGLQNYLPGRVPSWADGVFNSAGAALGLGLVGLLQQWGALTLLTRQRQQWFAADAQSALVLLALWPAALLFPAAVPFGLGQVFERLELALALALRGTPFIDWLPLRETDLQPLVPVAELLCVMLGLLIPLLLAYAVTPHWRRRLWWLALIPALGLGVSSLSAALSYGPHHAWSWLTLPVLAGIAAAELLGLLTMGLRRRTCAALLLLALAVHLSLLNQAWTSAYFWQTLQTWEQGRFIRFNGLAQWLGWLWPYATLLYVLQTLSRSDRKTTMPA